MKIIAVIAIVLLGIRFYFFYQSKPQLHDGQQLTFETTLLSEPKIFSKYQVVSANYGKEKVGIILPIYPQYHYADSLKLLGKITFSEKYQSWNMYYPAVEKEENNQPFFPLAIAAFIRQQATNLYQNTLPPDFASLLMGIVFGVKGTMTKSFSDVLRTSGVFHVVAASGMNVVFVAGFLQGLFGRTFKRQIGLMLSVFGIWFYALLSGAEPSILRATIMASILFVAQIIGRQYLAGYILLLTGYLMLVFSPLLLLDIGFQLSFLATAGLIFISPFLATILSKGFLLKEDFITTVAAQIATLPLLVFYFGSYSIWSILVNALVLWTIAPLMILGGIAILINFLVPFAATFILWLTLPFLYYFELVIRYFGKMGGTITMSVFSLPLIFGYYFLLIAVLLFVKQKQHE